MKRRGSLNVWELTAADELLHAYHISVGAPAPRDSDLGIPKGESRPGAADDLAARRVDLLVTYQKWRAQLADSVVLASVRAVLFHDESLSRLDRTKRWRNGTAKQNLLAGLRHFAALRGNTPRAARGWKMAV
jgi:hypothetical protein